MQYPDWIGQLLERFSRAGEEAYLVGGCLRDTLLGIPPHDFDIATSALPSRTAQICSDLRVVETGIQHGTVTVVTEHGPVEITTFRIDGSYTDSRHPDQVRFASRIHEDLSRRDFTVNAMAYHPQNGLVDLFGGEQDLRKGIIRAVGEPSLRFREDALRILRAFRFSAQLNFSIDSKTLEGAAAEKEGLRRIAKERIGSECLRLLIAPSPAPALREMLRTGVFPYVFGDFCPQDSLLSLLSQAPANTDARLGLLFAETSEETAKACLQMLKCSKRQITGALAVRRGASFSIPSPSEIGRFRAMTGDYARDAAAASILLGHSPADAQSWLAESNAPCCLADLALSGRDLQAIGLCGKEIGQALSYLLERVMEDPALNQKEVLCSMAQALAAEIKNKNKP